MYVYVFVNILWNMCCAYNIYKNINFTCSIRKLWNVALRKISMYEYTYLAKMLEIIAVMNTFIEI